MIIPGPGSTTQIDRPLVERASWALLDDVTHALRTGSPEFLVRREDITPTASDFFVEDTANGPRYRWGTTLPAS